MSPAPDVGLPLDDTAANTLIARSVLLEPHFGHFGGLDSLIVRSSFSKRWLQPRQAYS